MKVYKKIMDVLGIAESAIQVIIGVVITVVAFLNVCVRYLSNGQMAYTEELVVNIFVLMIMCGCALCARDGSLISLSLVFDSVGKKGKKILAVIFTIISIAFYVVITYTGWEKAMSLYAKNKLTASLLIPEGLFMLALPLGGILLILHSIEYLLGILSETDPCMKDPEDPELLKEKGENAE
jgi:TRAP-type C4-dicarboxylate transport system, small permease component